MSNVIVRLATENAALRSGLNGARAMVNDWANGIKGQIAGAFAFGAVIAGIQQAMEKAGELVDIGQRYGVGVENLQKYANAAQVAGASLQELEVAFKGLVDKQQAALAGSESAIESFKKLGMSVEDIERLDAEQLFLAVSDSIAGSSDKALAFSAMMDLVGGKARALFETMQNGSASIVQVGESFSVMSEDTVVSLDQLGDEISMATESVKNGLGFAFVFVVKVVKQLLAELTFVFRTIFSGFYEAYQAVSEFVGGILDAASAVGKLFQALIDFVTFDWDEAEENFNAFADGMQKGFKRSMDGMTNSAKEFWDELKRGHGDMTSEIGDIWNPQTQDKSLGAGAAAGGAANIARLEEEAKKKLKLEEEIKKAREEADAAQRKAYFEMLSLQEKINMLKEEEWQAAVASNKETLEGVQAMERRAELIAEIGNLQRQQSKAEEDAAKKIEDLRLKVAEAERESALDAMDLADKRVAIETELAQLRAEAAASEEEALTNRLRELELAKELKDIKAEEQQTEQQKLDKLGQAIADGVQAPSDFLQSIGGGGNMNQAGLSGTEAMLEEYRKQRDILAEIAENTGKAATFSLTLK